MKLRHLVLWLVLLLGALVFLPAAQAQSNTCPGLVERAMSEIGTNCASLGRNSACYGFNNVLADFDTDVPDNYFSVPSDRAELSSLRSIQTAPLNETAGTWGIATLNVQANLPGALPGQSVVFILLGNSELENAVPADEALILPEEPLEVTALRAIALRRDPSSRAEVVGTIAGGTPLLADGTSPDGNWLRVFFVADRLASAWVNTGDVQADSIDDLPVIRPDSRTPMQAFRFQTNVGGVDCSQAPSALFVQGPEDIEVDISANGVDIRIGSSIILRTLEDGSLQIFVISGGATLNPNSDNPLLIAPGFTTICPVDAILNGNCDWEAIRMFNADEEIFLNLIQPLFQYAANLLHYAPAIPEVVCASGVGGVECELRFPNAGTALDRAAELCATAALPASVCGSLFPGGD